MFCVNCGEQIEDDAKFCRHCGAVVEGALTDELAETYRDNELAKEWGEPVVTAESSDRTAPYPYGAFQPGNYPTQAPQAPSQGESGASSRTRALWPLVVGLALCVVAVVLVIAFRGGSTQAAATNVTRRESVTAQEPQAQPAEPEPEPEPEQEPEPVLSGAIGQSSPEQEEQSTADEEAERGEDPIYYANGYILPQSATRLYTTEELEQLSNYDLFIARNEIYARHGRRFKSEILSDYFSGCSWYVGTIDPENFNDDVLSDVEKANAQAMLSIEQERDSEYL